VNAEAFRWPCSSTTWRSGAQPSAADCAESHVVEGQGRRSALSFFFLAAAAGNDETDHGGSFSLISAATPGNRTPDPVLTRGNCHCVKPEPCQRQGIGGRSQRAEPKGGATCVPRNDHGGSFLGGGQADGAAHRGSSSRWTRGGQRTWADRWGRA
jgi:hypothetical protein